MQASAADRTRQFRRLLWQVGFFALFVMAPVFNVFRYDLTAGHAWLLGMPWRLGLDAFLAGKMGALEAGLNILLRLFLPILVAGGGLMYVAWRWGRIYCGWLCPHFSAVETINSLMRRASGKQSIWDGQPLPPRNPDGSPRPVHPLWWVPTIGFAVVFAFLWAVVLLTYLLPPAEVYGRLWHFDPTRNQALFLSIATGVLTLEFLFARHLFCRFGCAVGLFQSLAWMSNRGAMVVGYARPRAADCAACYDAGGPGYAACEGVCPMRLRPRTPKHKMFACTQCAQCVQACGTVQQAHGRVSLLKWVDKDAARSNEAQVSLTGSRD
ncbi:MAG TPA: 4Fe-4S binding protein [Methyloversatilis sp.]